MKIHIPSLRDDKTIEVLKQFGFGLVESRYMYGDSIETVRIWTNVTSDGNAHGFEIGILRRELGHFASYELVIDTDRLPRDVVGNLVMELNSKHR